MEPFKNLLGIKAARKIAAALKRSHARFSEKDFLKGLEKELEPLELKDRMVALEKRLSAQLDASPKSFPILLKALRQNDQDTIGLAGFLCWPLTHFVARHGLEDFDASLATLRKMTQVFTGEFAVRPFFLKDEKRTLEIFRSWTQDENVHVRRLASEGSRPLLPWGQKLPRFDANPELTWPILKALEKDPERYVQKSVANHFNDLSKKHGDWVVAKLARWSNPWVVRHALRTLVKKGHPGALKLLGVENELPELRISPLSRKTIKLGDSLETRLRLKNTGKKPMKVVVDVELHLLKANGTHNAKVFKGRTLTLAPGENKELTLRTPIKRVTTRKYHFGTHHCALVVNGQRQKKSSFELSEKSSAPPPRKRRDVAP
jgi:3-methyladenine DNA glycosylase AlkC